MRLPLRLPPIPAAAQKLFQKKKKDLLGIDIGSSSVKIVYLKGSPGQWSLVKWSLTPYGSALGPEAAPPERRAAIVSSLQNFTKDAGAGIKRVSTSVSGNTVIVRYVKLNKIPPAELLKNLKFEAEPYIPFNIEDVYLSFHILGDVMEDNQTRMETVLVAAKKETVDIRVDLLKEAGFRPSVIDVDAFALENALEANQQAQPGETTLLLGLGASIANLNILEQGLSRVVRDVFIAGNSLTKAVQRALQCDAKTAEEKKCGVGLVADGTPEGDKTAEAIKNALKDLVSEVQRSIDFYQTQAKGKKVTRGLLAGGGANLKGLDQHLAQELHIPFTLFNPFEKIADVPADLGQEKKDLLPQFAVAIGLATRREGDSIA